MNKFFYVISTLVIVILAELSTYLYIQNVLKNKSAIQKNSPYSFSNNQISSFGDLLNFYSLSTGPMAVEGVATVRLVGTATQINQTESRFQLNLCSDQINNPDNCTPMDFGMNILHFNGGINKVEENSKIQIDMKYELTKKVFDIAVTQLK